MSDSQKNQDKNKAVYSAPIVVRISLRPEEAVLGHCKVSGSAGPAGASCRTPAVCRTPGS
jgi:hypothetical protein